MKPLFEFAQIRSINYSTGVITFYEYLENNYRSTYPVYADPSSFGSGLSCGPATIVGLTAIFDQEVEINGINFLCPDTGSTAEEEFDGVKAIELRDVFVTGPFQGVSDSYHAGPTPSFMRSYICRRVHFIGVTTEIDKLIGELIYIDCWWEQGATPDFQSSSINKAVLERCRVMNGILGTPRTLIIKDTTAQGLLLGPVYGYNERLVIVHSFITSIGTTQAQYTWVHASQVTFSNGTIKVASGAATDFGTWNGNNTVSNCPIPWAVPGAKVFVGFYNNSANPSANGLSIGSTGFICGPGFTVLDVYPDAAGSTANFCVDTTLPVLPVCSFTFTATVSNGAGGIG